ncbi:hypothetical protein EDB92DRAFT_1939723 [Lactarius akahatsu]|uniref:Uncharacterized protein n=1 Tax=Lactarius akahatsu TaxID=416441 RepID=A0AAD4QHF5_9AGAM|nr:hypothetical protein EDB92DRAFT_1939723 [Lactarius akahatsu]
MNTGRAQVDPSHEPLILDSSSLLSNNASSGNGNINEDEDDDGADIAGPTVEAHVDLSKVPLCKVYPDDIAAKLAQPDFPCLIQKFIYDQEHLNSTSDIMSVSSTAHPMFYGKITVYPSAIATIQVPSNISRTGGMCCERICAVTSWRKGASHYDTVFVNADSAVEGIHYLCALVNWFSCKDNSPDKSTGMWIVEPYARGGDAENPSSDIIHLNTILRAAHLLPVFGSEHVSRTLSFTDTLDTFSSYYINKYVDHHAFKITF